VKTVVYARTVHVAHALVVSTVIVHVFFECSSSNQKWLFKSYFSAATTSEEYTVGDDGNGELSDPE
jgi:hypothetical protein